MEASKEKRKKADERQGHTSKRSLLGKTEDAQVLKNTKMKNSKNLRTDPAAHENGNGFRRKSQGVLESGVPHVNEVESESQNLQRINGIKTEDATVEHEKIPSLNGSGIEHGEIESEARRSGGRAMEESVENAVARRETPHTATEWPSRHKRHSNTENGFREDEDGGLSRSRNAVLSSGRTSHAVSEIHLDQAEGSTSSEVRAHEMPTSVLNEQEVDGMHVQRLSRSTAGVGDSGIAGIPRKAAQKLGERYHAVEAEGLMAMGAREQRGQGSEAGEPQDEQKPSKFKVTLEGDMDKTFFLNSNSSLRQAKEELSKQLGVTSKNIVLRANGRTLSECEAMGNLGGFNITVELTVDDSEDKPVDVQGSIGQPKVVQVKILQEDGTWKYAKVGVMHFGPRKHYLGGYRDKRTGRVYYHVVCQTEPKKRTEAKLVTREVQVNLPTVESGVNTSRVGTTQTSKAPLSTPGRIVDARPYIPYNEKHRTMVPHRAAQIIQAAWRRYILRKFILKHFKKLAAGLQERANEETTAHTVVRNRRVQTMTAAAFPSFRSHFSDSLAYFHCWVKSEAERLASIKTRFARKAAMYELLRSEQKILYGMETQRLKAFKENLRRQDMMFLDGTARSRAVVYEKGNVTLIDDLNIQKAGVFKEMFASYSRTDTSPAERLETLNCLRSSFLQEFGMNHHVTDLMEILDRETDLITIGIPNDQLVYLRKRFETKFLHLVRDPDVNPQAKYYRKSHLTERKYAIRRCQLCHKNLPSSLMFRHVRMYKFRMCMSCAQLEQNVAKDHVNLAPYKRMLSALRSKELEKNCRSSIPFLIQPLGIYFLVNVIWNGKSILGRSGDLTRLRLTRWVPDQEWSVWNTVLLTEEEVTEHERIPDPLRHYPEEFILQVRTKNILGRMHFMYLVDIDKDFKFDRPPMGSLPRDHRLYTSKHHAAFVPDNTVPEFFKPT